MYQTVQKKTTTTKKSWFGSSTTTKKKNYTNFYDMEGNTELERQFSLILDSMYNSTFEASKALDFTAEEMDGLLKNRNDKWMAQLPTMMQNQSLFIAVGAGHLVGEDGLIKGLRAQGYTVTALKSN